MLVAHTIDQCLTVLAVVHRLQRDILRHHLLKRLGNLIFIAFVLGYILHICIRLGILRPSEEYRRRFYGKGIACLRIRKLCDRSDIPGKQFFHFDRLISYHRIDLTELLVRLAVRIIKSILAFQYTGTYLNERVLTDKRIHHSLEYIR